MKLIKKIIKYILKGLLVFVCFIATYLLSAFVCTFITTNNNYQAPKKGIEVFLISNGVHTDICLPLAENDTIWNRFFSTNEFVNLLSKPKYISFGWGDKGFFLDTPTWADLTFRTAFKATFLPSPTALHVTYKLKKPQLSATVKSFTINKSSLKKLEQYIVSYIQLKNNKTQLIDCCRYPNIHDNFYEAKGNYHLFRTCNVWTNNAIKVAGVKTSIWTPFDLSILYQFK